MNSLSHMKQTSWPTPTRGLPACFDFWLELDLEHFSAYSDSHLS